MIKHATASTFVFHQFPEGWRFGLVAQPRLGRHMIVGGHVEPEEAQAEAALREAVEESGLRVRLLACPAPGLPPGVSARAGGGAVVDQRGDGPLG